MPERRVSQKDLAFLSSILQAARNSATQHGVHPTWRSKATAHRGDKLQGKSVQLHSFTAWKSDTWDLAWRCFALREREGRDTHMGPAERWQCQVLRQMHHSNPHSPKEPRAASNRMWDWERAKTSALPLQIIWACATESMPLVMSLWPSPLCLPFCASGSAMGHFWAQSCSAVHHRYSELLEPELEIRYSTVHSQLYCPPYSPPPPHPHLPPMKRCHIHQGLTVEKGGKNICQILNFKWIYPKPLGNSCLRKVSMQSVFQMQTFCCSVPCCWL